MSAGIQQTKPGTSLVVRSDTAAGECVFGSASADESNSELPLTTAGTGSAVSLPKAPHFMCGTGPRAMTGHRGHLRSTADDCGFEGAGRCRGVSARDAPLRSTPQPCQRPQRRSPMRRSCQRAPRRRPRVRGFDVVVPLALPTPAARSARPQRFEGVGNSRQSLGVSDVESVGLTLCNVHISLLSQLLDTERSGRINILLRNRLPIRTCS